MSEFAAPEAGRAHPRAAMGVVTALVALAIAGSGVILALAVVAPVYSVETYQPGVEPRYSLVREFGYRVLLVAGVPMAVSVIVAVLLHAARKRRQRSAAAMLLSAVLLAAAAVGAVTILIPVMVVPIGLFLVIATWQVRQFAEAAQYSWVPVPIYGQPDDAMPFPTRAPPPRAKSALAVASFVLGLLGIFWVSVPLAVVALPQTGKTGLRGRGFAVAALLLSGFWAFVVVSFYLAWR